MGTHTTADGERRKIPLGVPSIDRRLSGGVRGGTSLLAIGPYGTGHTEFLRTAAVLHGNWQAGTELFDLEYGDTAVNVTKPSRVRYVSLNETEKAFRRHIHDLADDELAYPALEEIAFHSLAAEVAGLGPIEPGDGTGFHYKSAEERAGEAYEPIFREFDRLVEGVDDELVIIDAISDFFPITEKFLDPADLYFITQTLCHVVSESDGVLLCGANEAALDPRAAGLVKRSFEAVLDFGWYGEGTRRRRTLSVTKFPEFARESGDDDPVTFDLVVDRARFGISELEKIPPNRGW